MAEEVAERKAQADEGALNIEVAEAEPGNKVALDIDDAPFLQEEEPEEEAAPESEEPDLDAEALPEDTGKKSKKKLIIMGAVGALLLIAAGVAGWWFFLRTPPPPPPTVDPEIIKVPSGAPQKADPAEFVVNFSPYWIELPDGKGGVVFLVAKFSAITRSERLAMETQNKMPILRDAVYYYLKNKTYDFLINPENVNTIKTDLSSVLSGYLGGGKIDDMLFESYLGR